MATFTVGGDAERVAAIAVRRHNEAVMEARKRAYEAETDHMVGQVLRGEISRETYLAAVDAIKARLPYLGG